MSVTVKIPTALRKLTQDRSELEVEAATLRELIHRIEENNQGFKPALIRQEGGLTPAAVVYVNEQNVRFGQNLETPLKSGDEVVILPACGCS